MSRPDGNGPRADLRGQPGPACLASRLGVPALFVLIAALYVGSVPRTWFLHPDSAVYLGLGRSLAQGEGYTFNHYPYAKHAPVFPLMLSLVYRTAGEDFVAMQAMVALCGAAALAVAWLLVRARAGRGPALAAVVLTAACCWFWSAASNRLWAEIPYTLFSMLALWVTEREIRSGRSSPLRWLGAAALGVVALYTHMVGVALIPALALGALLAKGQKRSIGQRLLAAAILGLVCSAAFGYWFERGHALTHLASYADHTRQIVEETAGYQLFKLGLRAQEWAATSLSIMYDQVSWPLGVAAMAIFVLPGLVDGFRRVRSCAEFYLCSHYAVSAIWGGETAHDRYVVPVLPLIFYYGYLSLKVHGRWIARLAARGRPGADAARLGVLAPRILMAVVAFGVLSSGLYNRARCSRGASKFGAERRAEAVEQVRQWEQIGRWARELPEGTRAYVGSGGSWGITYFFTELPLYNLTKRDRGDLPVVRGMVHWGADVVIYDGRGKSRRRFLPLFEQFPECFEKLKANDEATIYRLDKPKLRAALKKLEATWDPSKGW